ncbi:MAG: hypothetical protein JKY44_04530 [Flavobacteriaceae bacterium]|nr:hypothetical protein [Flavobacteriaceae bacterium]
MKILNTVFAVAVLSLASGTASAEQRTTNIEVSGLYCSSCPYIAAGAINAVKSAEITDGSYNQNNQTAQFVVSYDDAITTPNVIAKSTSDYGYEGKVIN